MLPCSPGLGGPPHTEGAYTYQGVLQGAALFRHPLFPPFPSRRIMQGACSSKALDTHTAPCNSGRPVVVAQDATWAVTLASPAFDLVTSSGLSGTSMAAGLQGGVGAGTAPWARPSPTDITSPNRTLPPGECCSVGGRCLVFFCGVHSSVCMLRAVLWPGFSWLCLRVVTLMLRDHHTHCVRVG